MSEAKKWPRLFVRSPDSGEPWAYMGLLARGPELRVAFSDMVEAEIFAVEPQDGEVVTLEFKRQDMTDAEVEALPDM